MHRSDYCGNLIDDSSYFDAELVENVFSKMKRGKAAGLDGISAEHVIHCVSKKSSPFCFSQ